MSKKVAILQSNYLPWKGVFDMINQVDEFIFLEDVLYTTRDWRNRNKIKTNDGELWITVPVKKSSQQLIYEAQIDNSFNWQHKHYKTLEMYYSKSPYYKKYEWLITHIFKERRWDKLSDLNIYTTKLIAELLNIKTKFSNSVEMQVDGKKDDKLIQICKKVNATHYLSGPSAKNYIIPEKFAEAGIVLEYIKYEYPRYKQLYEPFNHYVSILDLLFNCGPDAPYYIWGWREDREVIEYDTL